MSRSPFVELDLNCRNEYCGPECAASDPLRVQSEIADPATITMLISKLVPGHRG